MRAVLPLLLFALSHEARGAEVRFLAVIKGSFWEQSSAAAPAQEGGNPFQFRAFAELTRSNALGSASLKWASPVSLTRQLSPQGLLWDYTAAFATRAALNNSGPNGTYTFVTQSAADGTKTNVVTLSADVYPNAPRVANFADAQGIDSKADFPLRWDSAGTGANGFAQVRIFRDEQIVFQTPSFPKAAGALNGSAAAVVIPANTLSEGGAYRGEITIWRRVTEDLTGFPGAVAWAAYTQRTKFPLRAKFAVADVHWYGFFKTQRLAQTSAHPPFLEAGEPFEFTAFAEATAAANIKAVSIGFLAGSAALMNTAGSWSLIESFASQPALEARFPATLTIAMQTAHNGTLSLPLTLPAGAYPAAPQISNFHEANAIESPKPFLLRWNPLAGGTADDFVQARLTKGGAVILSSGNHPFASNALHGLSTSFSLPAGLLAPGESAEISIVFLKASARDSFSYPNGLGLCGFARQTTASIRARGGNVTTPRIRNARRADSALEFDFPADLGRQYTVQASRDFSVWTDLLITNAPGTNFFLRLPINPQQRSQTLRLLTR